MKEELQIVERLAELSLPTFTFIKSCLVSKNRLDKKWAVEQMVKLYGKCIPTEITGEGGGPVEVTLIKYAQDNPALQIPTEDLPGPGLGGV